MSEPSTRTQIRAFIEEATQSEEGSLDDTCSLKALTGWDSMGMVMFMGLVQETYAVELSVFDLRECATLGELATCVTERLAR